MRFLIDEMFSPQVADRLRDTGHDAVHVEDVTLTGAEDAHVLAYAADAQRVVVTENVADFVPLLDQRTALGLSVTPVVVALKRSLPSGAGALVYHLTQRLNWWAEKNPTPYRHVHWLP